MGRKGRDKPKRLAEKLLQVRKELRFSQSGIIDWMGLTGIVDQSDISDYERGVREPTLKALLEYARAANVYVDVLIDDEIDLPKNFPVRRKSMGDRKGPKKRRRKKRLQAAK